MSKLEQGIDLKIDPSIDRICDLSNKSAGSTRTILYIMVLAALVQIIVLLNTFKYSWNKLQHAKKIESIEHDISRLEKSVNLNDTITSLDTSYNGNLDNIQRTYVAQKIAYLYSRQGMLERHRLENVITYRIPIINIPVHVNDTAIIGNMTLLVLLIILMFALDREEINLCISLKAVSNRYSDDSDQETFKETLKKESSILARKELIQEINKTRRNYHYNYLTMNEIFIKPNYSVLVVSSEGNLNQVQPKNNWMQKLINNKYWIICVLNIITVIHDLMTTKMMMEGFNVARVVAHNVAIIAIMITIIILTVKCNTKTKRTLALYNNFKLNNYKFLA